MDTQVQRVVQWRDQKRKQGYRPRTLWFKAEVNHLIDDLAAQHRQEPAQVVSEAIRAYAGMYAAQAPPDYVDTLTVRRLVAEYVNELMAGQIPQAPAPDVPRPRLPESSVLLPGEYGSRVQAIREAARELGRFTGQQMARYVNQKNANVYSTLRHLATRGELSKKGSVFFWVEPREMQTKKNES